MIVETAFDRDFLANAYLVVDKPGGHGVIIDCGGQRDELLAAVEKHAVTVEHLLITHHHWDHVSGIGELKEQLGAKIVGHPSEGEELRKYDELADLDDTIEGGECLTVGDLAIDALHTPGHTAGGLAYVVNGEAVFTSDTLFRGSVGGNKVLGSTSFDDVRHSIMEVLMSLPAATTVYAGHMEPTTVGSEWENNPFIRVWRGLEPEGTQPCRVGDDEAVLVVWAEDYDGGHKAWVRWTASGQDDLIPGSQVTRLADMYPAAWSF